jgi:uncharacterized protein
MLIEFAITNYLSIRETAVLDLRAEKKMTAIEHIENIIPIKQGHLIRVATLYGANAAGKSNFLCALNELKNMVLNSHLYKLDEPIPAYRPFKLDANSKVQPTVFKIQFIAKNQNAYIYEVRFEVAQILQETLYVYPKGKETHRKTLLYTRYAGQSIEFGDSYRGKRDFFLNPNQLLLSKAGIEAIPMLSDAYRFFSKSILFLSQGNPQEPLDRALLEHVEQMISSSKEPKRSQALLSVIQAADTGIAAIYADRGIKTVHKILNQNQLEEEVIFNLSEESSGTQKLVVLTALILPTLAQGDLLIVDELNKDLHPLLTRMLIELFQQDSTNANAAQMICATHDATLLDKKLFRRDQIYLVNKSNAGMSTLGRLSDFKGISKLIPLDKWYLEGLFKGTPAINKYQIKTETQ